MTFSSSAAVATTLMMFCTPSLEGDERSCVEGQIGSHSRDPALADSRHLLRRSGSADSLEQLASRLILEARCLCGEPELCDQGLRAGRIVLDRAIGAESVHERGSSRDQRSKQSRADQGQTQLSNQHELRRRGELRLERGLAGSVWKPIEDLQQMDIWGVVMIPDRQDQRFVEAGGVRCDQVAKSPLVDSCDVYGIHEKSVQARRAGRKGVYAHTRHFVTWPRPRSPPRP